VLAWLSLTAKQPFSCTGWAGWQAGLSRHHSAHVEGSLSVDRTGQTGHTALHLPLCVSSHSLTQLQRNFTASESLFVHQISGDLKEGRLADRQRARQNKPYFLEAKQ